MHTLVLHGRFTQSYDTAGTRNIGTPQNIYRLRAYDALESFQSSHYSLLSTCLLGPAMYI